MRSLIQLTAVDELKSIILFSAYYLINQELIIKNKRDKIVSAVKININEVAK